MFERDAPPCLKFYINRLSFIESLVGFACSPIECEKIVAGGKSAMAVPKP